jgi:hypothetical protein
MSIDRTPNPEAVHVRWKGGDFDLFSANISSLFLSAYWMKVQQLLTRVKAVS